MVSSRQSVITESRREPELAGVRTICINHEQGPPFSRHPD
jgi:hypothetical protein